MSSQLFSVPQAAGISGYSLAGLIAALVVVVKLAQPSSSKLDEIPTVGSTSWLGSWWAGIKHLKNAVDVIQEGYEKHKGAPFKVAAFHLWTVILTSREHVEELRAAPDDILSFLEGTNRQLQIEYTMGPRIHHNPYHIHILQSKLNRSIGVLYPEIRNEMIMALDDILDLKGNEWKSVPALSSTQQVFCRISNRLFVGLPLCRDPDWIDLNIQYALHIVKGSLISRLFPTVLRPLAVRLFTSISQSNQLARKLVGPMIEERLKYIKEYGNQWTDRPNDFLSCLMEEAEGPELTVEALTTRLLVINLVAIQTTSLSSTHALLYLAANPQYIQPLREEVEAIIHEEGWTKTALGKMRKVDSFLKECQRIEGVSATSMSRVALKDFTFSDGTFVPKGTVIAAASRPVHLDEAFYPNAHVFEPFRFVDLREQEGEDTKHQYVSTTPEYLAFGHGRHACPGRFFAASELKTMLAHIVVTYDVKLEDNATRPETQYISTAIVPDPSAKVMFRKRIDCRNWRI